MSNKRIGCENFGKFYTEGKVRNRREWRGVADTAYDFKEWLRTWGMLLGTFSKDLVPALNMTFYYRWMRFKHWQAEKYGRRRLTKARRQSRHRESRKRNRLRCPGPDGVLPPLFRICSGAGSVRM